MALLSVELPNSYDLPVNFLDLEPRQSGLILLLFTVTAVLTNGTLRRGSALDLSMVLCNTLVDACQQNAEHPAPTGNTVNCVCW